jgi:MFS family permease
MLEETASGSPKTSSVAFLVSKFDRCTRALASSRSLAIFLQHFQADFELAAPIEALPEISVTDVFFQHERGTYMGLYAFFLAGSNYFAPVICGFIADQQGWRWVFYWPTIFLGVGLIWCFFFLEETNYHRPTVGIVVDAGEDMASTPASDEEKDVNEKRPAMVNEPPTTQMQIATYQSSKSYWQRLSLWQPSPGEAMLPRAIRSLRYLGWPVIFYAGFSYGSYLVRRFLKPCPFSSRKLKS